MGPWGFSSTALGTAHEQQKRIALKRNARPMREERLQLATASKCSRVSAAAKAGDRSGNTVISNTGLPTVSAPRQERPFQKRSGADMKARQSAKIRELREALVASGFLTLDEQSKVLGLSRSTTWTILKGNHKASGLSAAIIDRMLAAPRLPPARARQTP
jgi:predicted DNA-binding transcriptional regulator AlpA